MLTSGIDFINFNVKKHLSLVKENLISIIKSKNEIVNSLSQNYKNSFSKKILSKYKKVSNYRIIGMGGSILGTEAIFYFLKNRIKKNLFFFDNLQSKMDTGSSKKKYLNIIVSKSGNTLETISNSNIIINGEKVPTNENGEFNLKFDLFKHGGGETESTRLDIPLLAEVPYSHKLMESIDSGEPIVFYDKKSKPNLPKIFDSFITLDVLVGSLSLVKISKNILFAL